MNFIKSLAVCFVLIFCINVNASDFMVMGDIDYQDGSPANEKGGFSLGQLDLFANKEISDDTRGFLEVVFEDHGDGFGTDVERFGIEKHVSDELNIAAGRFHTPLGYYNATFHHGMIMQFMTQRPFFLDFEDGSLSILPTHLVGLMVSGKRSLGNLDAGYQLGVGNGSSINTDKAPADREIDMGNTGDNNSSKAAILRLSLADTALGLSGGVAYMNNKIAEAGDLATYGVLKGSTLDNQHIVAADLQYHNAHVNFMAEAFRLNNDTVVPGFEVNDHADAWFAEISTPLNDKDSIGYRYESLDINHDDFYFSTILPRSSATQHVVTYRHDFDESNAAKLEYRRFDDKSGIARDYFAAQWAFMIP